MARYIIDNRPAAVDFEGAKTVLARTLQNAKNLLRTRMGEVPYDRWRGFDPAVFDQPVNIMNEVITAEVTRVLRWEPDVHVISAACYPDAYGYTVVEATVDINVRG